MNRPTIGDSLLKMGSRWIRTSFESKQAQFAGIPWFQPRECQGAHVPEIGFIFKRIMSEFNERIDDKAHVDKDMLMDAFNNMMDGYPVGTAVEFALTAI